ncbi:ankyrin [Corynespora cassiicola Philippines]|uniref:Ankyrin n=1 Tax=Corynespora cassiicola Philippines TaxID=1448308 RepID=A0A2T2NSA4_CORCC|nr:ankyrin [Corynespora cassiicola Philippines]
MAVRVQGRDGTYPIHCAARHGRLDAMEMLQPFFSSKALDEFQRTPLHLGAICGHKDVIEVFFATENDTMHTVRQCSNEISNKTPLHLALSHSRDSVTKILLEKWISPRALLIPDSEDITPIHIIMASERIEFMTIILNKIPDEDVQYFSSAPNRSKQRKQYDILIDLFKIIKEVESHGERTDNIQLELERLFEDPEVKMMSMQSISGGESNWNPVRSTLVIIASHHIQRLLRGKESVLTIWSIRNGAVGFMPKLKSLEWVKEVDWNQPPQNGRKPLAWIAKHRPINGTVDEERRLSLLEELWNNRDSDWRRKALNEPQGRHEKTALTILLDQGSDPRLRSSESYNAFSYALLNNDLIAIELLRVHDPDLVNIPAQYSLKNSPLTFSIMKNKRTSFEFLLNHDDTDPYSSDRLGETAVFSGSHTLLQIFQASREMTFSLAYYYGRCEKDFSLLGVLFASESLDPDDYFLNIMLCNAINCCNQRMVYLLLDHGANPEWQDDTGRTMLSISLYTGDPELFDIITERLRPEHKKRHLELAVHAYALADQLKNRRFFSIRLLEEDIDLNSIDRNNWTASECARIAGNSEAVEMLQRCETDKKHMLKYPSRLSLRPDNPYLVLSQADFDSKESDFKYMDIRSDHCIPWSISEYYFEMEFLGGPETWSFDMGTSVGMKADCLVKMKEKEIICILDRGKTGENVTEKPAQTS